MIRRFRRNLAEGLKAASFIFPAGNRNGSVASGWLAGLWGIGLQPPSRFNYRREAGTLYENGVVRTGLKWLSRAWCEAPLTVYRPDAEGEPTKIPDHPLLALLAAPNAYYDAAALWAGTILSWAIDGNAYWFLERNGMGQVIGLVYVPHFQIEPYGDPTGRALVGGYLYRVNGQDYTFTPDDILHFRNGIDPANTKRGLSDLGAELRSICTDNESQSYAAGLLRNFGVPGAVISPKVGAEISPQASEQIKLLWRERFTGDGRGDVLASPLPIDVINPGFSPEQLALDKLAGLGIPRICAAMGLDPLMLGLPSDVKTFSNLKSAREGAYENTLIPMQAIIDGAITRRLMAFLPGAQKTDRLGRDYSVVRCLAADMDAQYKRQSEAVGGPWLTVNEARLLTGLPDIEGGDVLYPKSAPPSFNSGGGQGDNAGHQANDAAAKAFKARFAERCRQRRQDAEREA